MASWLKALSAGEMTAHEALVRCLDEAPGPSAWGEIEALFGIWPASEDRDAAIAMARQSLSAHGGTREATLCLDWFDECVATHPCPELANALLIKIGDRGALEQLRTLVRPFSELQSLHVVVLDSSMDADDVDDVELVHGVPEELVALAEQMRPIADALHELHPALASITLSPSMFVAGSRRTVCWVKAHGAWRWV